MRILISAAEASSDTHGAQLLRALRAHADREPVEAFGIGGPKLREAGLRAVVDAAELLAMGFTEILSRLPKILKALRTLSEEADRQKPDVAVVIDYPDFHFRLSRKLKRLGIPVIYYIPPKIWAWRGGRIKFIKRFFSRVLCILPFEEKIYRSAGVPVKYVGNPLADELPMSMTREEARKKLGIPMQSCLVALMPGSRPGELKRHLEVMLDAAWRVAERLSRENPRFEKLYIRIPLPDTAQAGPIRKRCARWMEGAEETRLVDLRVSNGDSAEVLIASDAGLIKSGTSTLEAGLLRCPHAIIYRASAISEFIYRNFIRYRGPVGLVNLVAGWEKGRPFLVREMLMDEVRADWLSDELHALLVDPAKRESMMKGFDKLRVEVMGDAQVGPSAQAALEVLKVARQRLSSGSEDRE